MVGKARWAFASVKTVMVMSRHLGQGCVFWCAAAPLCGLRSNPSWMSPSSRFYQLRGHPGQVLTRASSRRPSRASQ